MRGPWVARDYYRLEGSTDSPSTPDGWRRTGDVATIDPEGYIRLVDRTKDLVKSGGEWISTVELENAIMGHPDVVEAAVVGIPHPDLGEEVAAAVVLRQGTRTTTDEIYQFVKERVAPYKYPRRIRLLKELPKNQTGKVLRKILREKLI